jgi:hypothetical protein
MAMKKQNEKLANATRTFTKDSKVKVDTNHSKYTNAEGYLVGGVDIEMSKPNETQIQEVQGQGSILPEKKRSAKWY